MHTQDDPTPTAKRVKHIHVSIDLFPSHFQFLKNAFLGIVLVVTVAVPFCCLSTAVSLVVDSTIPVKKILPLTLLGCCRHSCS